MKRHIFKANDGVICSSKEEVRKLLNIADNNGYQVYLQSLNTYKKAFVHEFGCLIGCTPNQVINNYTPREFLFLVSQFEKGDEIEIIQDPGVTNRPKQKIVIGGIEIVTCTIKREDFLSVDDGYILSINRAVLSSNCVKFHKDFSQNNNQESIKTSTNMEETVIIPADILRDGYNAASEPQKLDIKNYVDPYTGEVKRVQLINFYNKLNCYEWKNKLEYLFPFLKETKDIKIIYGEKVDGRELFGNVHIGEGLHNLIEPRVCGNLGQKSFYLNPEFNWILKEDDHGTVCLVPTRK
jgi:hypothetical protein